MTLTEIAKKAGLHPATCPHCGRKFEGLGAARRLFEVIKEIVRDGLEAEIQGFGKFAVRVIPPREIKVPATGDTYQSPEHRLLKFRCAKTARDFIEGNDG